MKNRRGFALMLAFLALSGCSDEQKGAGFVGKSSKMRVNPPIKDAGNEALPPDTNPVETPFELREGLRTSINGKVQPCVLRARVEKPPT